MDPKNPLAKRSTPKDLRQSAGCSVAQQPQCFHCQAGQGTLFGSTKQRNLMPADGASTMVPQVHWPIIIVPSTIDGHLEWQIPHVQIQKSLC